jgi:hypothetical protein
VRSHIIILSTVLAAISALAPRSYAASIGASGDLYTVEISLTASEPVRSVQLAIDYQAVAGDFVGKGGEVACKPNPDLRALFAAYRCDPQATSGCTTPGQLNAAMVLPKAVEGTTSLMTCTFESAGQKPGVGEFAIDLVESATTAGESAVAVPAVVRIDDVRAAAN